jgi:hypothetical protein
MVFLPRVWKALKSDAVDTGNDRFAMYDEVALFDLERGLDDPRIALAPVRAAFGKHANILAIPHDAQTIAVLFDFINPVIGGRDNCPGVPQAELGFLHSNVSCEPFLRPSLPSMKGRMPSETSRCSASMCCSRALAMSSEASRDQASTELKATIL